MEPRIIKLILIICQRYINFESCDYLFGYRSFIRNAESAWSKLTLKGVVGGELDMKELLSNINNELIIS